MNDSIHNIMNEWLDRFGTEKDENSEDRGNGQLSDVNKKAFQRMIARKQIDLHGLTVNEALSRLDAFISECKKERIKKILVIHGKGIHSSAGPVLKKEIHHYLQTHPKIGQTGTPGRNEGGTGAIWAIIR
ncbi:MAG: Smr/MutS family protein [Spirochaetales bacterium]|nr:Smr/MutS family protein [Spirochaetales bacterium]